MKAILKKNLFRYVDKNKEMYVDDHNSDSMKNPKKRLGTKVNYINFKLTKNAKTEKIKIIIKNLKFLEFD